MLDDFTDPIDTARPQPFDTVTLHTGALAGAGTGPYVVADIEAAGDAYELNHPQTHPAHQDWAATVRLSAIATITRFTETGPVTWAPVR